jgi:hypothetical protein
MGRTQQRHDAEPYAALIARRAGMRKQRQRNQAKLLKRTSPALTCIESFKPPNLVTKKLMGISGEKMLAKIASANA